MEKGTIKRLVEIKKALRKKYLLLRRGLIDHESENKKNFAPLIKPLNKLVENSLPALFSLKNKKIKLGKASNENIEAENNDDDTLYESESDYSPASIDDGLTDEEVEYYKSFLASRSNQVDRSFGVIHDKNEFFMGEQPVRFINNQIIVGDTKFNGTKGLYELLTKKKPHPYTDADLNQYKEILKQTGVHLGRNSKRLKAARGYKYTGIIRGLFKDDMSADKTGASYKYWDSADELVDRLRLLIASSTAGNTSHRNEIIEIIEELREANIIY